MWSRYKQHSAFVLGFHGCDEEIGESVLSGATELIRSNNTYDWLGSGIYFWEGSPARALEFAKLGAANGKTTKGSVRRPFVLGAIVDLGNCCNLLDADCIDEVALAYDELVAAFSTLGQRLPQNIGAGDRPLRHLDRATIELMHVLRKDQGLAEYDTVRAAFLEGEHLYPGAGFTRRGHVQIAVRTPLSIKGYFRPMLDASRDSVREM